MASIFDGSTTRLRGGGEEEQNGVVMPEKAPKSIPETDNGGI